jgi:streptogramin lyase
MANKRIVVFVFMVFLVASFTAFTQTTLPGSRITTPTTHQTTPDLKPAVLASPDPLGPATLIREYILPVGAVATTYLPSTGPNYPTTITYDAEGFIWFTDIINNRIYRLTPATTLNQTSTLAVKWQLPLTLNITRGPAHIIVDDAHTCVWFTDYSSMQISRLDWTTNRLTDWNIPPNWNIHPWDLIMDMATGHIWFTALNMSKFGELNPAISALTVYNLVILGQTGQPLPVRLAEMKASGSHFYMTDLSLDNLYKVNFTNPSATGALVYPLVAGGFSMGLALDSQKDVWVTQPANDLVNEQLVGSMYKKVGSISASGTQLEQDDNTLDPKLIGIRIEITRVRPKEYNIPPDIIGDPLAVWTVPSSSSWPWGIAVDADDNAWYTEYASNQIGMIDPSSNNMSEFLVPTPNSHPLYITVPLSTMPPFVTHVWFTELTGGKIGELFGASYVDVRVAPSVAPQYPPPTPGSIRWTTEPGAEIWIDAPSNGYNSAHHDVPERDVVNHLYARVVNLGVSPATSVSVKFYYHNMSVSFAQFIPLPPTAPSPTHWISIGSTTIASLPPSLSTDVYVNWTITASVPDHFCIGVQVGASSDINLYDNVAYRNFDIYSAFAGVPTTIYVPIWATNSLNGTGSMRVSLSGVPEGWGADIKPNGFQLGQGQSRLLNLTIQVPSSARSGMRAVIEVTGMINGTVTGMVWIEVDIIGKPVTTTTGPPPISTMDIAFLLGGVGVGIVLMLVISSMRKRGK